MARRTAIRAVAAAALLAASAGACSPSSADRTSTGNTVATEAPQTTTTNPYAVPAVIDAAYINRVLAGLDAAVGDVTRMVVRTRTIPREAYDRLAALYTDPDFLQIQIDNFQADIRKNFAGYRPEPGNQTTAVSKLITSNTTCIFAEVQREYSAVGTNASAASRPLWIALRPLDRLRDQNHYNPVHWSYIYDGFPPDRSEPSNPCVA